MRYLPLLATLGLAAGCTAASPPPLDPDRIPYLTCPELGEELRLVSERLDSLQERLKSNSISASQIVNPVGLDSLRVQRKNLQEKLDETTGMKAALDREVAERCP